MLVVLDIVEVTIDAPVWAADDGSVLLAQEGKEPVALVFWLILNDSRLHAVWRRVAVRLESSFGWLYLTTSVANINRLC